LKTFDANALKPKKAKSFFVRTQEAFSTLDVDLDMVERVKEIEHQDKQQRKQLNHTTHGHNKGIGTHLNQS
jgi:hypothetical protein